MSDSKQAELDAEALAKKAREEARSGGTDAPPTDAMKQKMADEKDKKAVEKAPTTKTEMGKRFKSGGVTRADGCITKGHTKAGWCNHDVQPWHGGHKPQESA